MATAPPTPIGIVLPIQDGNSGYFDQSFDTLTAVKSNIINLINTRPGERRMQPTFGSRIWNIIFEQNVENLSDIAVNVIREDVTMWIPNVTVINVTANVLKSDELVNNIDIYRLHIAVQFMLNMTKQTDTVTVVVDNITG
jgi:phage baseplate assembly protein W